MPGKLPPLSLTTFLVRSLRYFRRTHATVALGIAAATAVIVGALVVGDSVRGSLRGLVLDRLANIDCLLHARTFFDPQMIHSLELTSGPETASLAPAIILSSSTVEKPQQGQLRRASQVQILAIDASFLEHLTATEAAHFPSALGTDQIALNATLAQELAVSIGDELTLRVSNQASGVPADNPLGRRDATSTSLPRQTLVAILPDRGIGGVSFLSGQAVPRNVFASLTTLQDILECGDQVNAALVLTSSPAQSVAASQPNWCDELNSQLRPSIEDYDLQFERHRRVFPDPQIDAKNNGEDDQQTVFDYYQLSSKELILDDATSEAVVSGVKSLQPSRLLTYLANSISKIEPSPLDMSAARSVAYLESEQSANRLPLRNFRSVRISGSISTESLGTSEVNLLSREVPYSILLGVDPSSELALDQYTTLSAEELRVPYSWINSWLAEQIDAKAGDWVQIKYFEPETIDGQEVEKAVRFMVAGIVPLTEPESAFRRAKPAGYADKPTVFNDPSLTPTVPGITDQDSISNWDVPFKLNLEKLILPVDDAYWSNHRLTPKIFIPYRYAATPEMFASRFGRTTAIRIPAANVADEQGLRGTIEQALLDTRAQSGLVFTPVRRMQLEAATGTTPFDMLFLSLSFFVIVAALLLVALLFKLGIQQRTEQLGMLLAQGFTPRRVRNLLLRELTLVALIGAALGIGLGLAYARLMVAGLESWWLGAISSPFLDFEFTWQSLLIGAVAGMLASLAAIYLSLRKLSLLSPLTLLRGEDPDSFRLKHKISRVSLALATVAAFAACGLIFAGFGQSGMARAGSFFGSGMLLLVAALIGLRQWIEVGSLGRGGGARGSLLQLAIRAIARNPLRSSLSLGLLAVASFLIASMGVFQVSPSERGYGGFDLLAESSQPIYRNIASASVRSEVIGSDKAKRLIGTSIVPLRARRGEDASCNNLFQVSQPTVLGVSPRLQEIYDLAPTTARFEWAAHDVEERPWSALAAPAVGTLDSPIPVILDQNTAAWSLKQGASLGAITTLEFEQKTIHFVTVGLLSNSVLQGKLLIDESNFERIFPEINGYSFFLIRSGSQESQATVTSTLEEGWSDVGLDVTDSKTVLERLLGVQNTYISAFQSLGALGLLLGTFGLVAAQVRSVIERRRELALMQAVGFSRSRIARMLTLETALLLGGGLAIGTACAAIALVPYILEVGPQLSLFNPLLMLALVLVAGFVAALIAVRTATNHSVLAGLRSE